MRLTSALWMLLVVAGCEPDPSAQLLSDLARSERVWDRREASEGSTYWYEESECGQGRRGRTLVQVSEGIALELGTTLEDDVSCSPLEPYTYTSFELGTMPELHALCRELIGRWIDTRVVLDDEGILMSCVATEPGCHDACDDGFYIARRGFGTYE